MGNNVKNKFKFNNLAKNDILVFEVGKLTWEFPAI